MIRKLGYSGRKMQTKWVREFEEKGLADIFMKKKRYSSYKGEISPEVTNLLNRNFHATGLGKKLLTDITEFSIPYGKISLSSPELL